MELKNVFGPSMLENACFSAVRFSASSLNRTPPRDPRARDPSPSGQAALAAGYTSERNERQRLERELVRAATQAERSQRRTKRSTHMQRLP